MPVIPPHTPLRLSCLWSPYTYHYYCPAGDLKEEANSVKSHHADDLKEEVKWQCHVGDLKEEAKWQCHVGDLKEAVAKKQCHVGDLKEEAKRQCHVGELKEEAKW